MRKVEAVFAIAMVLIFCFCAVSLGEAGAAKSKDKVSVQLFVMSDCPYGKTAENAIIHTLKALKDYVNFELKFVVSYKNGKLQSLHGQKEVEKNSVQICVGAIKPDKQLDFIVEWNQNSTESWQNIAKKFGINPQEVQDCVDSGYGIDAQVSDAELCEKLGVYGSPTLFIDGSKYNGKRSSKDFFDAICEALAKKGKKPGVCDNPPPYLSYSDGQTKGGSCR